MKQEYLDAKLERYRQKEIYPFHMPGHKRKEHALMDPYSMDITEIEGFDNLHEPEGILLEGKERLAELYGAKESFFLVNGSTCGLLAAISAATRRGDTILMARNCHKAVYHAVELSELKTEYLYPFITKEGIQGSIHPEDVEEALQKHPEIKAVILTSPTYDGVLSDVRTIAGMVHEKNIPLIVDEAHGAHLGFSESFPASAVSEGADVVIQSFHKTLPSLTQTAVLHRMSERVALERIRKYLSVYQTSSPSYLLMASIDRCVRIMQSRSERYFADLEENLTTFYRKVQDLKHLKVLTEEDFSKEEGYAFDSTKILIYTGNTDMTGKELMDILRKDWNLELEMASGYYALALTGIMDTEDGFFSLSEALHTIDEQMKKTGKDVAVEESIKIEDENEHVSYLFMQELYGKKEVVYPVWEAEDMRKMEISLESALGKISAVTVSLYPPGIPLLLPGERIENGFLEGIAKCREGGLHISGLSGTSNERIEVVIP